MSKFLLFLNKDFGSSSLVSSDNLLSWTFKDGSEDSRPRLDLISGRGIDIVFVTETWFSDISTVSLDSFKIYRRDRAGHGGGVAIYIRDSLVSSEVCNQDLNCNFNPVVSNGVEQVWCELSKHSGDGKLLLGCIYRPPLNSRTADDKLKHSQTAILINKSIAAAASAVEAGLYDGLCLTGDFNYPDLRWSDETVMNCGSVTGLAEAFLDTLDSFTLHQSVREPTFFAANGNPTNVLDLIISDKQERVDVTAIGPPIGSSSQGHGVIEFSINFNSVRPIAVSRLKRFKYPLGDYVGMNTALQRIDWSAELTCLTIDEAYNKFCNIYNCLCDEFIPKGNANPRNNKKPWMTRELTRLENKKKRLFFNNQRTRWSSTAMVRNYRRTSKELHSKTRAAIISFERRLAFAKNQKSLFAYAARRNNNIDTSIAALNRTCGSVVTSPSDIADTLNDHFASVFQVESGSLPVFTPNYSINHSLSSITFTESEVGDKLAELDRTKSIGVDNIHPHVLSECAREFARPLTLLYALSLRQSKLPSVWKRANVTPIFKKGSRVEPTNYRPISLTSVVCKVMESIVKNAIMLHLISNNLMAPEQHGFVPGKACNSNLLETADIVTAAIADKSPVDMVFVDFSKAFDKVPHERLVHKLVLLGIEEPLVSWIRSFLHGREQRVVLGEHQSKWVSVTSGVPQGSVLGPTLFAAYINDLPSLLKNTCRLYADDLKLIARVSSQDDVRRLQLDLDTLSIWCSNWLMVPNIDKCGVMCIGSNSTIGMFRHYTLLNKNARPVEIRHTREERDLGVILTPDFKFSAQAAYASSKANRVFGMLKRTFLSRDAELWACLYRTYIRPQLEFAVSAWNPFLRRDTTVLEKVQRRVTKIPYALRELEYNDRLTRMGLTTLERRRTRGDLIEMYKISRGMSRIVWHKAPLWSSARESKRSQLRREIVSSLPRHNFFINRIANAWNTLPNDVIESESIEVFKSSLDKCNF